MKFKKKKEFRDIIFCENEATFSKMTRIDRKVKNHQNQHDLQILLVAKTTGYEGQAGDGRGKQFGLLPISSYFLLYC